MSSPSSVPGARVLAQQTAEKYRLETGESVPPGAESDLDEQVSFFLARNQFDYFVTHLVDWGPFTRDPNDGHRALADFLGCRAVSVGATTNFDELVEQSAHELGEAKPYSALDAEEAATYRPHATFAKIHGCGARDPLQTLWTEGQLANADRSARLDRLATWMAANLIGKDIVFVGFWTDWSYLQAALKTCISRTAPPLVVLVSPDDRDTLRTKAPDLWDWATGCTDFEHLQEDGATFLDGLRGAFGERFQEQLLTLGADLARELFADLPSPPPIPAGRSPEDLFAIRRDSEGAPPDTMPRKLKPTDDMTAVGAAHLILLGKGAAAAGPLYEIHGKRVRVVQGAGLSLAQAKKKYRSKPFPPSSHDLVVCAGAFDLGTPPDVVRPAETGSVVRTGNANRWVVLGELLNEVSSWLST